MSVKFVLGSSGSGKSTYLYEKVINESMAHPDKRYFFIVPEQFTLSTQKTFEAYHYEYRCLKLSSLGLSYFYGAGDGRFVDS